MAIQLQASVPAPSVLVPNVNSGVRLLCRSPQRATQAANASAEKDNSAGMSPRTMEQISRSKAFFDESGSVDAAGPPPMTGPGPLSAPIVTERMFFAPTRPQAQPLPLPLHPKLHETRTATIRYVTMVVFCPVCKWASYGSLARVST